MDERTTSQTILGCFGASLTTASQISVFCGYSEAFFFQGAAMAPQDLSCTQETELGRGSGPDAGAEVEDLQETSFQVSLVDRSEIF